MQAFDGGILENLGIMSLLRRGVERIIVINSCQTPLANRSVWDPAARMPTADEFDDTFAAIFGIDVDVNSTNMWDYHRNQVFAKEDFVPFASKLQDTQADGRGAVATMRLKTVQNDWWGIPAGQDVDLTTLYLGRITDWEARLPNEVRQVVFPENGTRSSDWEDFPNVATWANLGRQQVNLLATLVSSTIKLNAAGAFRHILAEEVPTSTVVV